MKKLLYAILAIVLVIVVGVGALLALVDPNQFKPLITEQVKKATGRDLVINGEIGWRFFPSIGFTLGETEFRNPAGFAEPNLLKLGSAELSVSVMPLFSRQLEIGHISLHDGRVFIQTRKDGVSNLDGLGQPAGQQEKTEAEQTAAEQPSAPASEPQAGSEPWTISLEGVELVNASAEIRDDKAGTLTQVSALNFTLSRFAPGEWTQAVFDIAGKNGELAFTAQGSSELFIVPAMDNAELKNLQLSATAKDPVNDIRSFDLTMDKFKAGDWSSVSFTVEGEVPDLAFDAKGQTQLKLNPAFDYVQLQQLDLASGLKGAALPRPEMTVRLSADADYDVKKGLATLGQFKTDIDEISLNGKGSFKSADVPVIRFALNSDNIDLDAFLGSENVPASTEANAGSAESTTASGSAPAPAGDKDKEPDLSALKTLDVAGTVKLGKLKAANAKLSNVLVDMTVAKGVLTLKHLDADLYDGSIRAQATVNANGKLPSYKVSKTIRGVQLQPLLVDVIDNDVLAGKGDITLNLSGTGLAEQRIREDIAGTVDINFADGAVYGVNIPEMIREARATLKGKKAEYVKEERKTDFSALTATFKLGSGKASTNNLHLASPLLRIAGKGETHLVSEAVDFTIDTSVVATSKGQGGKEVDEVADLTVPIDVKGNWTEPKFSLNVTALLKQNNELEQKAHKEVERGLEKLLGDKAKDEDIKKAADKLLKGLFN